MPNHTLITAHSGAEDTPDNSLTFVRCALALPIDALEVDVRRRADGTLALGHDAADDHAPTLAQAFELVRAHPTMCINCDLKQPGLEQAVYRLALSCGLTGRVIYSGTVDVRAASRVSGLQDAVEIYLNLEEVVPDLYARYRENPDFELHAAETVSAVCRTYGIRTVNMYHRLVTPRFCDRLAQQGLGVSAWTIDCPQTMAQILSYGVHNLTSRRPIEALAQRSAVQPG
ncbi:MAG: glycerophosphodiester phosphodiesterase [Eubacteriales bacterium]|nr:glycerophosphodiester phosphodiesterase [Eubacteriales bacterium]